MEKQSLTKDHWAEEKVRTFAPVTKEKATFVAIAHYADPTGWGSIVSYDRVARDTGQGASTVRRHVKALVDRGDLVTMCDLRRKGKSNSFFIPLVAETIEALEGIYKVSRKQLRLPLVQRDQAGGQLPNFVHERATPRLNLSVGVAQIEPVPINDQSIIKDTGLFILKTKKMRAIEAIKLQEEKALENEPVHPKMAEILAEGLRSVQDAIAEPIDRAKVLRDRLWGKLSPEESVAILEDPLLSSYVQRIPLHEGSTGSGGRDKGL